MGNPDSLRLEIDISVLRDWDLNAFEISDHQPYIRSMLKDYDLIAKFNIQSS